MVSKTRTKRRYRRRPTTVRKIAKQEAKKVIAKEIEVKFTDISPPGGGPTTIDRVATLTTYDIFVGARGTDAQTFIGERINPKGFYARCLLLMKSTNATEFNQIRIVVAQMRDATDITPTQLLRDTGADFNPIISQLSRDFTSRYRLLYDKVFQLYKDNKESHMLYIRIPAKRIAQMRYTNGGAIERGKIRMYVFSNTNTAGNEPTITWTGRLYYTDA